MASGLIAAMGALIAFGVVESMRRFYPAKRTWYRLRSRHGRRAVRAMRERFEATAGKRITSLLAQVLLGLVIVWVALASLLDKRWYEVVADTLPYAFVGAALLRVPGALRVIAARMRDYEREAGEDPDAPLNGDGNGNGSAAAAL